MSRKVLQSMCVLLTLCTVAAAAGPPGLIITDNGYYATVVENGVPVNIKITNVMDLRGGGGGGGGGGGDTPIPPPPSANPLVDAIAAITKANLSAEEATAIAATLNLSKKTNVPDSGIALAMRSTVNVVGGSLNAKAKFDKWYGEVQAAPGFTNTQAGLSATIDGVVKAYNLDPIVLKSLADEAYSGFQDGESVAQVSQAMADLYPNAAFDFTQIISLIMAILQLLKDLGILGG